MAISAVGLQTAIWNNNLRSLLLLAGYPFLLCLLVYAGGVLAFMGGAGTSDWQSASEAGFHALSQYGPVALAVALAWFAIAYFFNQSMVRAATGARTVTRAEMPTLYNMVENLCIARGVPTPQIQIIDTPQLNAFASGLSEKNATITFTRGIIDNLAPDELEAVAAHELTHILNRDTRLMLVAIIFAGMFSFLAQMAWRSLHFRGGRQRDGRMMIIGIVLVTIGYVLSILIQFALSRRREYMADQGSIELTKNPESMMRALLRLQGRSAMPEATEDARQMMLDNSLPYFGLFATHPSIEDRVRLISQLTHTPIPGEALPAKPASPRSPWT